jgi:hypothetical protein
MERHSFDSIFKPLDDIEIPPPPYYTVFNSTLRRIQSQDGKSVVSRRTSSASPTFEKKISDAAFDERTKYHYNGARMAALVSALCLVMSLVCTYPTMLDMSMYS